LQHWNGGDTSSEWFPARLSLPTPSALLVANKKSREEYCKLFRKVTLKAIRNPVWPRTYFQSKKIVYYIDPQFDIIYAGNNLPYEESFRAESLRKLSLVFTHLKVSTMGFLAWDFGNHLTRGFKMDQFPTVTKLLCIRSITYRTLAQRSVFAGERVYKRRDTQDDLMKNLWKNMGLEESEPSATLIRNSTIQLEQGDLVTDTLNDKGKDIEGV
jgi:hypothetical protein